MKSTDIIFNGIIHPHMIFLSFINPWFTRLRFLWWWSRSLDGGAVWGTYPSSYYLQMLALSPSPVWRSSEYCWCTAVNCTSSKTCLSHLKKLYIRLSSCICHAPYYCEHTQLHFCLRIRTLYFWGNVVPKGKAVWQQCGAPKMFKTRCTLRQIYIF